LLLRNQGLSSVSHVQLVSRCAGAVRKQSQAASPSWTMEIFHTIDVTLSFINGDWPMGRNALFWEFNSLSTSLNFSVSSVFFCEFREFCKVHQFSEIQEICEFCDRCLGTGCTISHWVVRKIVLCIASFAYSLLLSLLLVLFVPLLSY